MKERQMLFIYPDTGGNTISFSPAIEILSAYLQRQGIKVDLLHLNDAHGIPFDFDVIHQSVLRLAPDIIGITATSYQYNISNEIAGELKKRGTRTPVILGGVHATIAYNDLKDSNFDAFCIGEGELPLSELFRRLENEEEIISTPGFHFKLGNEIMKNPCGKVIEDLDDLPFRNYKIIDAPKILKLRNQWLSIAFSRGCPYACNFCINQKLKEVYHESLGGKYFRRQSIDRVISEILHWTKEYHGQINVFNFDDDLLTLNKSWFLKFGELYRENVFEPFGIKYAINCRANFMDEEMAGMLKDSGCELVRIGFETGDQERRNSILGKGISDDSLFNAFGLLRKYRLRTLAFAMIGIPGECHESVQTSLKILRILKPTLIRMPFFEPFIGTPMYEYCLNNNLFRHNGLQQSNNFSGTALHFENISQRELLLYQLLFPWYLNVSFVSESEDAYKKLIEKYSLLTEEELLLPAIRKKVLDEDLEISSSLNDRKIPHFDYDTTNSYYYHFSEAF